jgi:hypothetical protein
MTGRVINDFRNPIPFLDRKRNRKPEENRKFRNHYTHILTGSHDYPTNTNSLHISRHELQVEVIKEFFYHHNTMLFYVYVL